ncbi:uncharacterized protein LOC117188592 [Drosophila miranda]|uniref:uncharacterized protein LOC117188592 n=1 Tax=Drosophila miranda TaxID=7229 RepID=UPI00143F3A91|nr:uncharacterized protein LOC117188592 [Drosophila miranda]
MVFTVLFVRFVGFSCGVYGAVNWWRTPSYSRNLLNVLLVNCTPLSVMKTLGAPKRAIMRSRQAFINASAVAFLSGTNSVHFENRSTSTNSIEFPCFDLGRGPTKSAHTVAHGSSVTCVNISPAACS